MLTQAGKDIRAKMTEIMARYGADKEEIKRILEQQIPALQRTRNERQSLIAARDAEVSQLTTLKIRVEASLQTEKTKRAEFQSDASLPITEYQLRLLDETVTSIKGKIDVSRHS